MLLQFLDWLLISYHVKQSNCKSTLKIQASGEYENTYVFEFGDDNMNRIELKEYIQNNYTTEPDYPWIKYPDYEVFRHSGNKKWFALIMGIPKNKLGLQGESILEVANFKCDPVLMGSLLRENGFFPAYHMSKTSWITVALDGSVSDDKIIMLLNMSFDATAPKIRKKQS